MAQGESFDGDKINVAFDMEGATGSFGGEELVLENLAENFSYFDKFLMEQNVTKDGVNAIIEVIKNCRTWKHIPEVVKTLSSQGHEGTRIFELIKPELLQVYAESIAKGGPLSMYWVEKILEGGGWIGSLFSNLENNLLPNSDEEDSDENLIVGSNGLGVGGIGLTVNEIIDLLVKIRQYYTGKLPDIGSIENDGYEIDNLRSDLSKDAYVKNRLTVIDEMLGKLNGVKDSSDVIYSGSETQIRDLFSSFQIVYRKISTMFELDAIFSDFSDKLSNIRSSLTDVYNLKEGLHGSEVKDESVSLAIKNLKSSYDSFVELWDQHKVNGDLDVYLNDSGDKAENIGESILELLRKFNDKFVELESELTNEKSVADGAIITKEESIVDDICDLFNSLYGELRKLDNKHYEAKEHVIKTLDDLRGDIHSDVCTSVNRSLSRDLFNELKEYSEFFRALILGINTFKLDSGDYRGFFYHLINYKYKNEKDRKDALRGLLPEHIDDIQGLNDDDYIKLYLSLYPERRSSEELDVAEFVKKCVTDQIESRKEIEMKNNGGKLVNWQNSEERDEFFAHLSRYEKEEIEKLKRELRDFIDLMKTTQYWGDVCGMCYREEERIDDWYYIMRDYAMGYFLPVIEEKDLYDRLVSSEKEYYVGQYLPVFSGETVKDYKIPDNANFTYYNIECCEMLKNRLRLGKGERGRIHEKHVI